MQRFKNFLKDITLSFVAVGLAALVFVVSHYIKTTSAQSASREKIAIALAFLNETEHQTELGLYEKYEKPEARHAAFAAATRMLFSAEHKLAHKIEAQRFLRGIEYANLNKIFSSFSPSFVQSLVQYETPAIREFMRVERENIEKTVFLSGWDKTFHSLWTVFAITSSLCLIVYWWKDSYATAYWPYKKWWFWLYLIGTHPWSYGIGGFMGLSVLISLVTYPFARRSRATQAKYKKLCETLNNSLPETREMWKKLFFQTAIPTQIEKHSRTVSALRDKLKILGTEIESVEHEYAEANSALYLLKELEKNPGEATPDEAWVQDLEDIVGHRDVQAVQIVTDRSWGGERHLLEIYTGKIHTYLLGFIGPLQIQIDLDPHRLGRFEAYERMSDNRQNNGDTATLYWSRSFCFGDDIPPTIKMHLKEHRPSLALAVMMQSFHASGLFVEW